MQIQRLFEIIYLLLEKKSMTAGELAQHFEVSPRTIYRDIETLSASGIPVYAAKGKGGGISLLPDFVLNKTVLTEEEKIDILASLKAVDAVSFAHSNSVLPKLSSLFGHQEGNWIEVDFSSWGNGSMEPDLFNTLKRAVLEKKLTQFIYSNGRGTTEERQAEPLKLAFKGQAWYLYAYCLTRKDYRFFKLRRIRHLIVLDKTFTRPVPAQLFPPQETTRTDVVELTLKLSKEAAFRVYDEFEHYRQSDDGSFIVKIKMPRGEWIWSYITSFGEACELLEPPDLREEMRLQLERMLSKWTKE